jgi:hypothetical protein
MPANIQELQCAFSKTPQSAIGTPSSDLVRFNTTSSDIADVELVVEDDAKEIGKGTSLRNRPSTPHGRRQRRCNAT